MKYQLERFEIDKNLIKSIADSLAGELAERMYYKLMFLRFLPEIKAIESGKIKALKGKGVDKFFNQLKS